MDDAGVCVYVCMCVCVCMFVCVCVRACVVPEQLRALALVVTDALARDLTFKRGCVVLRASRAGNTHTQKYTHRNTHTEIHTNTQLICTLFIPNDDSNMSILIV